MMFVLLSYDENTQILIFYLWLKDFVGGVSNIDFKDETLNLFLNEALDEINCKEASKYK